MDFSKTDGVIFDLDGTLWDTTATTLTAWEHVSKLEPLLQPAPTLEQIKGVMGMASDELMATLFPKLPAERREEFFEVGCAETNAYLAKHGGTLYDGIKELLEKLSRRMKLFIVSNCDADYIPAFYSGNGLSEYFADYECVGRTGLPKSENIKLVVERNELKNPVYVGDTALDYRSATSAGVPFIFASYGFGHVEGTEKISQPLNLLKLI